ncbi:MAG: V-type ATP synthase subunit E [Oscillospiraceae bacterium]|jgi:V/A-type H+-transporting ATPase subunit E|nr:V-type ATP synthase subunit E [Oscillospiraceae bacterium]
MNIDAILERIAKDARQHAAQTLSAAREKADQLGEQAQADIDRARAAALREAEDEAAALRDRMLRMAALDERKDALAAKRALLDEAFAGALVRLRAMPPEQATAFHLALLQETAQGDESLIVSQEDAPRFDAAFFDRANAALQDAGKRGHLHLSEKHRPTGGGFILERGGMEINCTYESVLRTRRPALEADVAAVLFG